MRTNIITTLLSTLIASFSFANAAEMMTQGTVLSFNMDARTLLMSDDVVYTLPEGIENHGFDIGDTIVVMYNIEDNLPVVESITFPE